MRSFRIAGLAILLAFGSHACRGGKDSASSQQGAGDQPGTSDTPTPVTVSPPQGLPAIADLPRTTDPVTSLSGLDKRITRTEKRLRDHPELSHIYPELIAMITTRASVLGDPDDHGRAVELAEAYVAASPKGSRSHITRARVRASLHRFDDASSDLALAVELGAHPSEIEDQLLTIAFARGQLDDAARRASALVEKAPSAGNLVLLATILDAIGKRQEAEEKFRAGLAALRSVSPLELSWLLFQWGRIYEKSGELARARYLYEIAHARLPRYSAAASHLASILNASGDRERARTMLNALVADSSNPEYLGLLTGIERELGNDELADQLASRATAGFDALLSRFPTAFADHAARYFLGPGNNPTRAFALAKQDLAIRQTSESYALAIEAGLAAKASEEACDLAQPVATLPHASKSVLFQAWRAFGACERSEARDQLAARLGIEAPSRP